MTALGAGMTAAITLPLLGIAAAALSSASDFEQSMNILQQVSGASADSMAAMQAQALELGAVTSFSAGEAAEGMLELGKAGMKTEDIMAAIPGVMDLAAAGGVSLAEAAGLTAATLNAFHLEASESARVADLLAGAANASAADISDLGTGMQQAGFAFSMANQPVENLAASLAILTNVGLTGSDAGTALKNAFMRMMNPTKEANSLMKSLGISFYDAQGNMKALPDIIDNLNIATSGLTNEQRDAALATIFLSDGMKAMIPLMDQGKDGFDEMVTEISKTGAATDVANARMKGLSGGIEYLKGSVDSFLIGAALPFLDTLGSLARGAGDALTAFGNLPQPLINASLAFAGILAVMGPILLLLPTLAAGFALLTGPVGLTVLAIAALGAVWAANVGGIRDVTATAFASVQLWFTTTATALDTLVTNIGTAFDNTEFPTLESLWTDFLAGDFETIATKIKDTAFDLMVNLDTELNITGKAEQLRKSIATGVNNALAAAMKVDFSGAKASFDGLRTSIQTALSTAFSGINVGSATAGFSKIRESIQSALATAFSSINASGVSTSLSKMRGAIEIALSTAFGSIQASGAMAGLTSLGGKIKSGLDGLVTAAGGFDLSTAVTNVKTNIATFKTTAGTIRDDIMSGLTTEINGLDFGTASTTFSGLVDKISQGVRALDFTTIDWTTIFTDHLLGPIGTAINGLNWLMDSTQFSGLVTSVTDAIGTIKWGDIGTSLAGLGTAVFAAAEKVWADMVTDVTTSFSEIDWTTMSLDFAAMITELSTSIANTDWVTFGSDVVTAIKDALTSSLPADTTLADGLVLAVQGALAAIEWGELGTAFGDLVGAIGTAVQEAVSGVETQINAELEAWVTQTVDKIALSIPDFSWDTYVENFVWPDLPGFDWATYVANFEWPALPVFDWNTWVATFEWPALPVFDWSAWVPDFSWPTLPSFDWSRFVPKVNWSIPAFPGWSYFFSLFGTPPTGDNETAESEGSIGSVSRLQTGTLPTTRTGTNTGGGSNSLAMAGNGGITINVNVASMANDMNLESLAYNLATKIQQRTRR